MTPPLIQLKEVSKRYPDGTLAVHDVTLHFSTGEFVAILGPSGAGKSTLLRMINGLVEPTTGSVRIDGLDVTPRNLRPIRKRVGMVFQQFNLVGRLNVMTNVLCGRLATTPTWMSFLHLFRDKDVALATQALDRVGIAELAWRRADQISGGQQQRVAVARALVQEPRAILADEPVASLDPVTGRQILDLLAQVCRESGITLLVNLHQVELARQFAHRIVGLNRGRVVFDGRTEDFTESARDTLYAHPSPEQATDGITVG